MQRLDLVVRVQSQSMWCPAEGLLSVAMLTELGWNRWQDQISPRTIFDMQLLEWNYIYSDHDRVQVLKFSSSWHLSPKGCNEVQQVVGIFFIFHLNGPWWFGISWITCWLSHLMFLDGVAGVLTTKKFEAKSLDKSQKYIPCKSTTFVFNMFVHQLFFFPNVNLTMSSQTRCKICSWGKDHSSTKLWLQELASSPNEIIFAVVCKEVLQESIQCWRYRNSNWYDWFFLKW